MDHPVMTLWSHVDLSPIIGQSQVTGTHSGPGHNSQPSQHGQRHFSWPGLLPIILIQALPSPPCL